MALIETIAGTGERGYNGDGQLASDSKLDIPYGIALDQNGQVYISERDNHRIRKIDRDGIISTIAGTGELGYNGDGQLAVNAQLYNPEGITVDQNGLVYIVDYGNNRIRLINKNGIISTVAGNGVYGCDGGQSTVGVQSATSIQLCQPNGVAVDQNGQVYIADSGNQRIRKIDKNGMISTIAGTGQYGYNGDGQLATNAQLGYPSGIVVDKNGQVYIADYGNHRIRKIGRNMNQKITLKKYEGRDSIKGTNLVAHLPSVRLVSPLFYERILSDSNLLNSSLDKEQEEIVQHLINELIYTNENAEWDTLYHPIVLLSILIEIGSDRFLGLTNNTLKRFRELEHGTQVISTLHLIDQYKKQDKRFYQVADQFIDSCLYHYMRRESENETIDDHPDLLKHARNIFKIARLL